MILKASGLSDNLKVIASELEYLRENNERLQRENAYLKKRNEVIVNGGGSNNANASLNNGKVNNRVRHASEVTVP